MKASLHVAARPQFTYIDACAGYGGLGLSLEIIFGEAAKCALAIERDACAAAAYVAWMETAHLVAPPVWSDLFTFCGKPWRDRVDCLAAGFPCQPWSTAGQRKGTEDDRWLWPALARAIREVGPWLVWLENVPGLISGGGLEHVLFDFAQMGFDAEWGCVAASDVEATQERERVFILAVANADSRRQRWCNGLSIGEWARKAFVESCGGELANVSIARSGRVSDSARRQQGRDIDRASATVGDAAGERERIAHDEDRTESRQDARAVAASASARRSKGGAGLACTGSAGLQGDKRERRTSHGSIAELRRAPLWPPRPGDVEGWRRVLKHCPELAPALSKPELRRLAHGLTSRTDALRLFGNGVVPLAAATAFLALANRF